MSTIDAALSLIKRGYRPVPIPRGEKGPKLKGWQQSEISAEQAPRLFQADGNIGVILGHNGLTDIDLDCDEAIKIADAFLPATGLEFGRASARRAHRLYCADPALESRQFVDPVKAQLEAGKREKEVIVEIRGTKANEEIGFQTMFPPSVHPSDERVEYTPGVSLVPASVDASALVKSVTELAAAVLLARYFPGVNGGRSETFMALHGALVRGGWERKRIFDFSMAIRQVLYGKETVAKHCNHELDHTIEEHAAGNNITGIPRLKEKINDKAVGKAFEWLGIGTEAESASSKYGGRTVLAYGPSVHEIADEAVKQLVAVNDPPKLFLRARNIVEIAALESGPGIIDLNEHALSGAMDRSALYYAMVKVKGEKGKPETVEARRRDVPVKVVRDIMNHQPERLPFPTLRALVEAPVILADGRILSEPGYDAQSGLFYAAQRGFTLPAVAAEPSREDAIIAREFIENEVLVDFPFVDDSSRHNVLAAMVTVIAREAISGNTPACVIEAGKAGTGKGLLMDSIAMVARGSRAAVSAYPQNNEELRKAITTLLMRNPGGMIAFDNVVGKVDSPDLARALTAGVWQDRRLGGNVSVEIPVRATWFLNGNNIDLSGGDMARRAYWIRMEAEESRPQDRTGFRHSNLLGWISEHRGALVAALLTMCKAWIVAGRPACNMSLGSFQEWIETVGGILHYAGADQFFLNAKERTAEADSEEREWESFLSRLHDIYGKYGFTSSDVVSEMQRKPLSDLVPISVAYYLERSGPNKAISLGRFLQNRRGTRYGDRRLSLRALGKASPIRWIVLEEAA